MDRFPATLWLAPEPCEPFRDLTETLCASFPSVRPYGGQFDRVIPHLTVADRVTEPTMDRLEAAIAPSLLVEAEATEAWLMEGDERLGAPAGISRSGMQLIQPAVEEPLVRTGKRYWNTVLSGLHEAFASPPTTHRRASTLARVKDRSEPERGRGGSARRVLVRTDVRVHGRCSPPRLSPASLPRSFPIRTTAM